LLLEMQAPINNATKVSIYKKNVAINLLQTGSKLIGWGLDFVAAGG